MHTMESISRHTAIGKPEESDKNFRLFLKNGNTLSFSAIVLIIFLFDEIC